MPLLMVCVTTQYKTRPQPRRLKREGPGNQPSWRNGETNSNVNRYKSTDFIERTPRPSNRNRCPLVSSGGEARSLALLTGPPRPRTSWVIWSLPGPVVFLLVIGPLRLPTRCGGNQP